MHVSPFDEVFRTPSDFTRRIARNVHIVLREEGHFDKVVDPAGGCWYVEKITAQLAEASWALFQDVEKTRRYGAGPRTGHAPGCGCANG